jgi:hypothetical protein
MQIEKHGHTATLFVNGSGWASEIQIDDICPGLNQGWYVLVKIARFIAHQLHRQWNAGDFIIVLYDCFFMIKRVGEADKFGTEHIDAANIRNGAAKSRCGYAFHWGKQQRLLGKKSLGLQHFRRAY